MAAIAGMDWRPLTMRELVCVSEAMARNQWDHTAATIANICSAFIGKALHPNQFHPLRDYEVPKAMLDDPEKHFRRLVGQYEPGD